MKYKISKVVEGCRKDAYKHSPGEDSKTGKVIEILETVASLTIEKSPRDIENKIGVLLELV